MRPALPLSIALLVAASVVTVGIKAAITDYNAGEDFARVDRDIVSLLARGGFRVTARAENQRPPTFYGQNRDCRVMLRQATDPQSFGDSYRLRAAGIGSLRYRIGAKEYIGAPALRLWIDDLWAKTWRNVGWGAARPAALAIAFSPRCSTVPDTAQLAVYPLIERR